MGTIRNITSKSASSHTVRLFHLSMPCSWLSPLVLVIIVSNLVTLTASSPAVHHGITVDWTPNSGRFSGGPARVTLRHGESIELNCSAIGHVTYKLVSKEEMDECEWDMTSRDIGTCGGGGSITVRKMMKTVASSPFDITWPEGTYYIIATPASGSHFPVDYFCRERGMKLELRVIAKNSKQSTGDRYDTVQTPFRPQSRVNSEPIDRNIAQAAQEYSPSPYGRHGYAVPAAAPGVPPFGHPVVQQHHQLPAPAQYAYIQHQAPMAIAGPHGPQQLRNYASDDLRVFHGDSLRHRVIPRPRPPIAADSWTLLDAEQEYESPPYGSSSTSSDSTSQYLIRAALLITVVLLL